MRPPGLVHRTICLLLLAPFPAKAHAQSEGTVTRWLLLGPEQFDDAAAPFALAPPREILLAEPAAGVRTGGRVWRAVEADVSGRVDLIGKGLDQEELATAYLHAWIWCPTEQEVLLSVGSDDGIEVYVNGYDVHSNWTLRGWAADQDRFPARLGEGWNRLLLRVANNAGGFAGSARILAAGSPEEPVEGVRIAQDRPAGYRPVQTRSYVTLRSARFEPAMALVGGAPQVQLEAAVRNLGTLPAEDALLQLHRPPDELLGEWSLRIGRGGTNHIIVRVDPRQVAGAALSGSRLVARLLTPDGRAEDQPIRLGPAEVLAMLAAEPALDPAMGTPSRDVAGAIEQWQTGRRILPDFFGEGDAVWVGLLRAYDAGDRATFEELWGRMESRLAAGSEEIKRHRISFVGNSHIDMAWLWDREETIDVVQRTFRQALDFMEEYPFFLYAQSQMQTYAWMDSLYPDLMARMDAAVEAGRWVPVGGMWVEADCNLPSGESFVRQLLYGKGYARDRYGIDIRVGWNPDSFGYARTLPMIFKGAGLDYFITQKIGWNDTTTFPHRLFWWEAPDGSRVLGYFPFTYSDDVQAAVLARRMSSQRAQQPGLTDMLDLYGVGDHGGGPTRAMIERYVEMTKRPTFPTVQHETPLAFLESAEQKYTDLPVWEDELYLEYHRGTFTTHGDMKRRNRLMESRLESAEKAASLAALLDAQYRYPAAELDAAWLRTLFNQFHDILPGSGIRKVYDDANADYDEAETLAAEVSAAALEVLAGRIRTDAREGVPVVVFNPLSWARSEVVGVPLKEIPLYPESLRVVDAEGRNVPVQQTGEDLLFRAEQVPGIGYRTYWVVKSGGAGASAQAPSLTRQPGYALLRNGTVEARIVEETGGVGALSAGGREFLTAGGGNILLLHGDMPAQWDAWNIGYTGQTWRVEPGSDLQVVEEGPLRVRLRATRRIGGSRLIQDYLLDAGSPILEVRTRAEWQEAHRILKASFELTADPEVAVFEIPYGVVARAARPQTEAEKAKWEVPGNRWVDMSDRGGAFGLALLDDSKYGYSVAGNVLGLSLLRAPKYPDPQADMGDHTFRYALFPHEGDWRAADVWRRGAAFNMPLEAVVMERGPGRGAGSEGALLEVDSDHVSLTAFKRVRSREHREQWVVRLCEMEGLGGPVEVTFPVEVAAAWETNLMEDPGTLLRPDGRRVRTRVGAYGLQTIVIVPRQ